MEKRKHVSEGDTPQKPKKSPSVIPRSSSAAKSLPFSQPSPSQKTAKKIIKKCIIHSPRRLNYSPKKKTSKSQPWSMKEKRCLLQYIALFREDVPQDKIWPSFGSSHKYWTKASQYIHDTAKTNFIRSGTAVRLEVFRNLASKYKTLDEAEDDLGLGVDVYLEGNETSPPKNANNQLDASDLWLEKFKLMSEAQIKKVVLFALGCLATTTLQDLVSTVISQFENCQPFLKVLIQSIFAKLDPVTAKVVLDELFLGIALMNGIDSNPGNFASLSIEAMKRLQVENKNNLVYKYSQAIAMDRSDGGGPLMPLNRMPFGLIEYSIEFFTCTNIMQISEPLDFKLWHETMVTEFPGRFQRLFAGPMWSGLERSDIRDPLKARTNIPCTSKSTQQRIDKKSPFHSTTEVQVAALDQLKSANPKGRFWIKVDGTDVKTGLMESMKKVWNGDEDLGDGELQKKRQEYEKRLEKLAELKEARDDHALRNLITGIVDTMEKDIEFLHQGFIESAEFYRKKFNTPNAAEQSLKDANWDVVEYQNLLEEAQNLLSVYEDSLAALNPLTCTRQQFQTIKATMKDQHEKVELYLRNLFKKKRIAADHIEVVMVSDEKRNKKPYALPVKFIPCRTLKDQFLRDLTRDLKLQLTQRGLTVVGTTTDGEFCSLRTRGETRALHLWQLIHDARQSVQRMSQKTLLEMLLVGYFLPNGDPVAERPHPAIPASLLLDIHNLLCTQMSLLDAVTNVRSRLVPNGYQPYPFRRNNPETLLDKLRSIVATYIYRHTIEELKAEGADFSLYLYNPEMDPVTGMLRHDRGDHNHIVKRIATSTRGGKCESLNYEAFDDVLKDPKSGLTHAALVGKRKQSLKDAERLLSYAVVESLERHGHANEAQYVRVIANWHEATDGRGISQLKRCQYNYRMLNYILDVWMPWHSDNYDFTTIDINRPVENIRGMSRECIIEITTNIESQEMRRRLINQIGYPEHPRASGTDDLEKFFGIVHRDIGTVFTLKQFKEYWPKGVREFTKRMDASLPFYYHTLNDRYREEEASFDDRPDFDEDGVDVRNHPLRLHRVRINQREDSSIFVCARAVLPARHAKSIRQNFHKPTHYLS